MLGGLLIGAIAAIIFSVNWKVVREKVGSFSISLDAISASLYIASAFFIYIAYNCDWSLAFDNHHPKWANTVFVERVTIAFSSMASLAFFIMATKAKGRASSKA